MFFELFQSDILVAIGALPRLAAAVILMLHQLVATDRELAVHTLLGASHAELGMLLHQRFLAFEFIAVLTFNLYFG